MKNAILSILFLPLIIRAQSDSVLFVPEKVFIKSGIYLTANDFRYNRLIANDDIQGSNDSLHKGIASKLKNNKTLQIKTDSRTIKTKEVWAYVTNGKLHIKHKKKYEVVPFVGAISFYSKSGLGTQWNYGSAGSGRPGVNSASSSSTMKIYLMNAYNGKVTEWSTATLGKMIQGNADLHKEYTSLSNGSKAALFKEYIKRYNERNPFYQLRN
jgi:hypothetical protein